MKIRKILTAAILSALALLTTICLILGPQLRDPLSPKAEYVFPQYITVDGRAFLMLPESAIRRDENGAEYVLIAEQSKKYPERCFEAIREDVRLLSASAGAAIVSLGVKTGDKVIVTKDIDARQRVVLSEVG